MERKIDRLDKYVSYRKLNDNKLTVMTGVSIGVIGKSRRKDRDLSSSVIEKVLLACPDLNPTWLLTGNGEMLKSETLPDRDGVINITDNDIHEAPSGTPIYDIDATCGQFERGFQDEQIVGYIDLPSIRKGAHIVLACGDSMTPKILDNDRIVLREIESWDYLYYGQIYLIVTEWYRMIKYIRKHSDPNKLILRSENSELYDDIEIDKKDIVKLFVVENILSIKNMM